MNWLTATIIASATVLASTLAVVITRYFQSKREQEVAHRDKKVELYDGYLEKLFDLFAEIKKREINPHELLPFMRERHRKLILWSGPKTLKAYVDWHKELTKKPGRVEQMIKMFDFFLAFRNDLGLSNHGIGRSHMARLVIQNPDFFMHEYKKNQNITINELIQLEQKFGEPQEQNKEE